MRTLNFNNNAYMLTRSEDEDTYENTFLLECINDPDEPEYLGYFRTRIEAIQAATNHGYGFRWVNVFDVQRCYGGPEEGGWWYDAGECIDYKFAASVEEAKRIRAELEAEYVNDGPGLGSMLSRGEYQVSVDLLPSEGFSNYSPYC